MPFEYTNFRGQEIYKHLDPDGRVTARVKSNTERPDDWLSSYLADSVTLETYPEFEEELLSLGGMLVAQQKWSEHKIFDLGMVGYLEELTTAKSMQDVLKLATRYEVNKELFHRSRHGRT
jgi:hypothetical protein